MQVANVEIDTVTKGIRKLKAISGAICYLNPPIPLIAFFATIFVIFGKDGLILGQIVFMLGIVTWICLPKVAKKCDRRRHRLRSQYEIWD